MRISDWSSDVCSSDLVAIGTVANMGGIAEMLSTGENRPRLGNAVYGLFGRDFTTGDGTRTMIVVVNPSQWANLLAALNLGHAVGAVEAGRDVSLAKDDGVHFPNREHHQKREKVGEGKR